MAEYIEREALLGIFDATISHLRDRAGGDGILLASIGLVQNSRDLVANFPTADVVEVVRCKDCNNSAEVACGVMYCCYFNKNVEEDGFCYEGC